MFGCAKCSLKARSKTVHIHIGVDGHPPQSGDDACLYCGGWMEQLNRSVTSHQEPASVAHHDSATTNQRQDSR